jgi:hypothetical protein
MHNEIDETVVEAGEDQVLEPIGDEVLSILSEIIHMSEFEGCLFKRLECP